MHALTRANAVISGYTALNDLLHEFSLQLDRTIFYKPLAIIWKRSSFAIFLIKFKGQSKPLISNLSFKICAGQTVVLLGAMGSNKFYVEKMPF